MDISKITEGQFNALRQLGITKSFQELDVDGDGKITDDDQKLATDNKVADTIKNVLASYGTNDAELLPAKSAFPVA